MTIVTRKTRWGQFLLLCASILSAVIAGIAWFVMGDDKGREIYPWHIKVIGIVSVLVIAMVLVWLAYRWRLSWSIGFSGRL